ncbi:hypothetical protein [Microlunatus parietis]|uniref:Uncharacterized protein n=1 Tax=Microlunatus parietis TaxID=682979 RepID=A0A7Y9LC86_9ACTN|nr:hypothetical protein [Microlunatus parietis]NYE74594.1 hypothetical protein [Microlunatus parietis]
MTDRRRTMIDSLTAWAAAADRYWVEPGGDGTVGWYGTGYDNWGVQTNQKYLGAVGALAALTDDDGLARRALAALRFSVRSHRSGGGTCADGKPWGHTWISPLGIERMMYGIDLLADRVDPELATGLDRLLVSEAEWIRTAFHRDRARGVVGGLWNVSGRNAPESNLWAGALLWRTAQRVADHPQREVWQELARTFMINGVSVPADRSDPTVVDGRPVRERFRGANFFNSYALDHHGYLNVGYMIICVSNAAILHFDLKRRGEPAPEALHRHQADLWRVVRPLIAPDGRLLRIGGDSRVRYAYCQEYLLPSLCYAADQLGDPEAIGLLDAQLDLIVREQRGNADGSFYGTRLTELANASPYYVTRLESDRACALGAALVYLDQLEDSGTALRQAQGTVGPWSWIDHDHQAVAVRDEHRLASYSWRAFSRTQGLCVPLADGSLAEWDLNLAPEIRVLGDQGDGPGRLSRTVTRSRVTELDGGFVTSGTVVEGVRLAIPEGWSGSDGARTMIAIAALPDGHTMIGIHRTVTADWWVGIGSVKGLHLNVPNDVLNGSRRRYVHAGGTLELEPGPDERISLGRWVAVDDVLGAVGLWGSGELIMDRSARRRGGPQHSLFVDELCFPHRAGPEQVPPGTVLVEHAFAVLAGCDAATTARFAETNPAGPDDVTGDLAGATVTALDGRRYRLLLNFAGTPVRPDLPAEAVDLTAPAGERSELGPGEAALYRL